MRIDVTLVDSVPVEVNTPADLERARRIISGAGRA
jgi:3-deoxy-manno-octulosonate cytidylyltransferase (CMP-KDO synthetase)